MTASHDPRPGEMPSQIGSLPDELPYDMQNINSKRLSGLLVILGKDRKEHGRMYYRDGEITHAIQGRMVGEEALTRMLHQQEGSFAFYKGEYPGEPQTIRKRHELLLLDSLRNNDEANRALSSFASDVILDDLEAFIEPEPSRKDSGVFTVETPDEQAQAVMPEPQHWPTIDTVPHLLVPVTDIPEDDLSTAVPSEKVLLVLTSINGRAPMWEIIRQTKLSSSDVGEILARLHQAGHLKYTVDVLPMAFWKDLEFAAIQTTGPVGKVMVLQTAMQMKFDVDIQSETASVPRARADDFIEAVKKRIAPQKHDEFLTRCQNIYTQYFS